MEATLCKDCGIIHKIGEDNFLCPTHPQYRKPSVPLFDECPVGCEQGFLPEAKQAWDIHDAPDVPCTYCSLKQKANDLHYHLNRYIDAQTNQYFLYALERPEAEKALRNYKNV